MFNWTQPDGRMWQRPGKNVVFPDLPLLRRRARQELRDFIRLELNLKQMPLRPSWTTISSVTVLGEVRR